MSQNNYNYISKGDKNYKVKVVFEEICEILESCLFHFIANIKLIIFSHSHLSEFLTCLFFIFPPPALWMKVPVRVCVNYINPRCNCEN